MPDFPPESVAFITGAASGIGLAVAKRLVTAIQIETDISKEEQVDQAVAKTVERFGRIDVCLNAAGISGNAGATADLKTEEYDQVLGVNLKGVWYCQRAQIRQLLKQELRDLSTGLPFKTRGSIINIGSLCSISALVPHLSPYTMAKHGVLGLTKQDEVDYAPEGIRVNCFCPGWIQTQITHQSEVEEHKAFFDAMIARVPMGRWGVADELAYVASFILSDKASFVTGASLTIDGGRSAH